MYYIDDNYFLNLDDVYTYYKRIFSIYYIELIKNEDSDNYSLYIYKDDMNKKLDNILTIRFLNIVDYNKFYIIKDALGKEIVLITNEFDKIENYINQLNNIFEPDYHKNFVNILEIDYNETNKKYDISTVYKYKLTSNNIVSFILGQINTIQLL